MKKPPDLLRLWECRIPGKALCWREERLQAARFPRWQFDTHAQVLAGLEQVLEVLNRDARLDAWTFGDEWYAPGVLIEVLFSLQAMAADRNSMVGCIEDVCVVELAHRFQLLQDTTDLEIDVNDDGNFVAGAACRKCLSKCSLR